MNKTAIKNYAIWARVQLIESAKQRAFEYEITEDGENQSAVETVGGRLLSKEEKEQRRQLIEQIRQKGYNQVMEEAAYTWFNRFIALRFMEVNGYLPSKTRVFTDESGAFKPEIMKEAMSIELDGLDRNKILDLLDKQDNEALYKYLLVTQCNAMNKGLPYMFEKIGGWTELLFPANLLRQDSVIGTMISSIPEEDWTDAVQIIGWLYQYYNSELKDETFALLKKNVKITKERIPAATQLFTPDWIVRYMVENSLGRLWYEGHKDFDKSGWRYYLDEAEQEPEVELQLQKIREEYSKIKPEEIKVIDPCMGSGHILVYAFDILMQIYTSAGWPERDAARSIVENNLYGLDIDDRAGQLAYFAIMMKARQYNRRMLNGDVTPNVISIQESNWMTDDFITYVAGKDTNMKADLTMLRKSFKDAKEYGSILNVSAVQYGVIFDRIDDICNTYADDLFQAQYQKNVEEQLLPLLKQSQIMAQKYDVVVTNPPYMGGSGMNAQLSIYVKKKYPNSISDLFSVFIERCQMFGKPNGYVSMITMHGWMFIDSYYALRKSILDNCTITSLTHHGIKAFEFIGNDVVQTCAFIMRCNKIQNYKSVFVRLTEAKDYYLKEQEFFNHENYSVLNTDLFMETPTHAMCYWTGEQFFKNYKCGKNIEDYTEISGAKNVTGDNERFMRLFWEVNQKNISRDYWALCAKGGAYRKYYGNIVHVIDWRETARKFYQTNKSSSMTPEYQWFKSGITYSAVTSRGTGFRYVPEGYQSESSGPIINFPKDVLLYFLGFYNSKIAELYIEAINPSINLQKKDLKSIPYIVSRKEEVDRIVAKQIEISKKDWGTSETTIEFKSNVLIPNTTEFESTLISDQLAHYVQNTRADYEEFEKNENELNTIFKEVYGFDKFNFELERRDISVKDIDAKQEIKALISFAVGCLFGRYSIDIEGLCYAGGEWDTSKYKTIIPDNDNIIPICDDDYFDDDIVGKFVDFVRKVYGEDTLEQNLRFIADALGGKGTPREIIRNYFIKDFYSDHCSTYSVTGSGKRPIYWLFSSGKKNGFKALIYMHRYQPDLLARMRTDYVHEQQERYRTQLHMLEETAQTAAPSERVKLNKQIAKLKDQALEIQKYEEKIHHLADQMISIDLDDGVKVNYAKFQDVLEKLK